MLTVITLLAGMLIICTPKSVPAKGVYNDSDYNEAVSTAKTTPFGAYPDTIEYTLGKMTSVNNSNMPAMDRRKCSPHNIIRRTVNAVAAVIYTFIRKKYF